VLNILKFKAVFAALILLSLTLKANGFIYDGDLIDNNKTISKMREMGDELYEKTGVTTVVVARKHLDQKEFLKIKDSYKSKLKAPYVLWIFAKTYQDRDNIGINQMFNSKDLDDKFDKDSLFSPWSGTFTKLITVHKSKKDPIPAAFLNGYADLADMLSNSYGVKLDSSIGSETRTTVDIIRVVFYLSVIFFLLWYVKVKFLKRGKVEKGGE
jgi:membrane-associated protease RseP (regulator of RpoE activity)